MEIDEQLSPWIVPGFLGHILCFSSSSTQEKRPPKTHTHTHKTIPEDPASVLWLTPQYAYVYCFSPQRYLHMASTAHICPSLSFAHAALHICRAVLQASNDEWSGQPLIICQTDRTSCCFSAWLVNEFRELPSSQGQFILVGLRSKLYNRHVAVTLSAPSHRIGDP